MAVLQLRGTHMSEETGDQIIDAHDIRARLECVGGRSHELDVHAAASCHASLGPMTTARRLAQTSSTGATRNETGWMRRRERRS